MSDQNYRILAVDDLPDNVYLLQAVLETEGYVVDVAMDGKQALHYIRSYLPDLVLLDVMMPEMNGLEVVQRLRQEKQTSQLPVILITAHHELNENQEAVQKANGFLHKPIDFNKLLDHVKQVLRPASDDENSNHSTSVSESC